MGLDITAYKNLEPVKNPELDGGNDVVNWETEWLPGTSMKWSEKEFPGRGEGVDSDTVYRWKDSFDFRAGSYSGYNRWRRNLEEFSDSLNASFILETPYKKHTFTELINFADNEGVIGPVVARRLYEDFKNNKDAAYRFSRKLDNGDIWIELYEAWEKAFYYAMQDGAVQFR